MTEASGSGTLQVVLALAERHAAAGCAVGLAFGRRPETPADLAASMPPGVTGFFLPWAERTVGAQLRAARALRHLVREWRPDLVHLHSSFAGFVGALTLPPGTRCVYSPHGFSFDRSSRVARLVYRVANSLVARRCVVGAVSEAEAAQARDRLGARRVHVVVNGIPELDPGRIPAPADLRPTPFVVATGRIAAQRRPAETARILAAVADVADVAWIGAATFGEDAPLHAAGVEVTGWLSREEGLRRLAEATAYVHWSAFDGLSLALLEAMALDVVVVASDVEANREVLGDAQVRHDPAAAAALVREVLLDPRRRAELLAAQRSVRGRFSANRMAADWLSVYGELQRGSSLRSASLKPPKIGVPWS